MDATEINERTDASGWKVMHCRSMLFTKRMTGRGRESVGPGTIARSLPGQTFRKKKTKQNKKEKKSCRKKVYRRLQTIARYENK